MRARRISLRTSARRLALIAGVSVATAGYGAAISQASTSKASAVAHAKKALAGYTGQVKYPAPGPAFDVAKLKGKTVEYIGIDMSNPTIELIAQQLQLALTAAGVKLFICDGKSNPADYASCATEGVDRKVGAIILESFEPQLIAQQIRQANAAHIPVIDGNNGNPTGAGGGSISGPTSFYKGESARVAFQYTLGGQLVADSVIEESDADAHVLIVATSDIPNVTSLVNNGMDKEFTTYCPACKVTTINVPIANWSTGLGPAVQAALARDPSIDYVIPAYDSETTFTDPAIMQVGRKVTVDSFNGTLSALQAIKNGQLIDDDAGTDVPYEGWAYADQAMRLMTGHKAAANEFVPVRVFVKSNVGALSLTVNGQNSGTWYGPPTYKKQFLKLWGVK